MTDDERPETIRVDVSRLDASGNRVSKASHITTLGTLTKDEADAVEDALKAAVRRHVRQTEKLILAFESERRAAIKRMLDRAYLKTNR